MLHQLRAEDHVSHLEARANAAGNAGVDEIIRIGTIDEDLGAASRIYLTDAAFGQDHIKAAYPALIEGEPIQGIGTAMVHLLSDHPNLRVHGSDYPVARKDPVHSDSP